MRTRTGQSVYSMGRAVSGRAARVEAVRTPLIAFRRGGVPEGINDGRTGFLCDTVDEMRAPVARLPELDRAAARAEVERRMSDVAIAGEYEGLDQRLFLNGH